MIYGESPPITLKTKADPMGSAWFQAVRYYLLEQPGPKIKCEQEGKQIDVTPR
jgi:hypothetical protein